MARYIVWSDEEGIPEEDGTLIKTTLGPSFAAEEWADDRFWEDIEEISVIDVKGEDGVHRRYDMTSQTDVHFTGTLIESKGR